MPRRPIRFVPSTLERYLLWSESQDVSGQASVPCESYAFLRDFFAVRKGLHERQWLLWTLWFTYWVMRRLELTYVCCLDDKHR